MKSKPLDPLHLDVEVFARAAGRLEGAWPLSSLPRLMQGAQGEARQVASAGGSSDTAITVSNSFAAEVTWSAQGRTVQRTGAPTQTWIDLEGRTTVTLECQRCLGPVPTPLEFTRSFRFVPDERQAAELDAESDDEVLVLSRNFDLRELVEDELILALPVVPRHEACPAPLPIPAERAAPENEEPEARENPFAALAALKRVRNT